jgi:hypothetical protein
MDPAAFCAFMRSCPTLEQTIDRCDLRLKGRGDVPPPRGRVGHVAPARSAVSGARGARPSWAEASCLGLGTSREVEGWGRSGRGPLALGRDGSSGRATAAPAVRGSGRPVGRDVPHSPSRRRPGAARTSSSVPPSVRTVARSDAKRPRYRPFISPGGGEERREASPADTTNNKGASRQRADEDVAKAHREPSPQWRLSMGRSVHLFMRACSACS